MWVGILFLVMWYLWYTAFKNMKNWDVENRGGDRNRTYHYVDKETADRWK